MASSPIEKNVSAEPPPPESTTTRLTRSAGLVSVGVMGSRVLGLVREQVLAYLFRPGVELDAFKAAYRIPNLLRDLFAEGALSKAFVSSFADVEHREGPEAGIRLANVVLNVVLLAVGAATVAGILCSDFIVAHMFFGEGFDVPLPAGEGYGLASKRELTVHLTRIMFPFLLLVSVAAVVMGILNARGRFGVPAWASAFFNVGSILVGTAGYVLAPRLGQHPTVGMAVGVVAGGALQLAWQLPSLFRAGFRYRPVLSFRDSGLRQVLRTFGPGALSSGTVQINVFINSMFASMGEGWVSWIDLAFRLMHLPIGLIGVAVSMATLPALSRHAARKEIEGFRETFSHAIRLVILFTVPASVGLIALSEPIIRLIYERGRFGPDDTHQTAAALVFYAFGLTSYAAVKIVTDGFYALQDVRAPLKVSVVSMVVNAMSNWFFISVLGFDHRGLALSTSVTVTLSFVALWYLLRRRSGVGRLGGRRTASLAVKVTLASIVMGITAFFVNHSLDGWLGHRGSALQILEVGASLGAALAVLFGACRLLGVSEMDDALRAFRPRRAGTEVK